MPAMGERLRANVLPVASRLTNPRSREPAHRPAVSLGHGPIPRPGSVRRLEVHRPASGSGRACWALRRPDGRSRAAARPAFVRSEIRLRSNSAETLEPHSNAVILVGAQAVYVHTESEDESFAVAPFTYDADIALDPELLEDSPALIDAMSRAGFRLHNPPGLYRRDSGGQVDLLVPHAVGGSCRRGAGRGGHGNEAARQVHGLEGVLVSHTHRRIVSLVADAERSCILKVAGPAGLLVSKVYKLGERLEDSEHHQPQLPKDAFDIYRLLRTIGTAELAEEFRLLQAHETSSRVTSQALSQFQDLFGARSDRGPELLVSYVGPLEDPAFIVESSVALSQDLLEAISP